LNHNLRLMLQICFTHPVLSFSAFRIVYTHTQTVLKKSLDYRQYSIFPTQCFSSNIRSTSRTPKPEVETNGGRSSRKRQRISYVDKFDSNFDEELTHTDNTSDFEEFEINVLEDEDLSEVDESSSELDHETIVHPNLDLILEKDLTPSLDCEEMEWSDDGPVPARAKSTVKKKKKNTATSSLLNKSGATRRDLDLSLPPIDNIRDIFSEITSKAMDAGLDRVINQLGSRPLRIATMCSGTESPLLALKLVQQSLEQQLGTAFLIEHVFSAEIEPYKQAYIQRNFNPPLLFRDITEFVVSKESDIMEGMTAYGAIAAVPRDIDILVAGSSCVDFSNLNRNKVTDLHARQGESADTYEAVRRYMIWASPPIVILENVIDAKAWQGIEQEIREIGYETKVIKVDTKDYYLPHTRQRKYMLALNNSVYHKKASGMLDAWEKHMEAFKRRASAPVSSFLLPADDPRILALLAREDLKAKDSFEQDDRWEACRGRHINRRLEMHLGAKKPVTAFLPEHGHRKWLKGRVPRELDVIDICHLVQARDGLDSQFKT
jgi:site-specific DNA-cytosine methylase